MVIVPVISALDDRLLYLFGISGSLAVSYAAAKLSWCFWPLAVMFWSVVTLSTSAFREYLAVFGAVLIQEGLSGCLGFGT